MWMNSQRHELLAIKKKKKKVSIMKVNPNFTIQQQRKTDNKLSSGSQIVEYFFISVTQDQVVSLVKKKRVLQDRSSNKEETDQRVSRQF